MSQGIGFEPAQLAGRVAVGNSTMLSRYLEAEVLLVSASGMALTLGRLAAGSVRICADLLRGATLSLKQQE